jgi:hypothetical protein
MGNRIAQSVETQNSIATVLGLCPGQASHFSYSITCVYCYIQLFIVLFNNVERFKAKLIKSI